MNQNKEEKDNCEYAIELTGVSKMYKMYNSPRARLKEAIHPFRKKYHKEFWALNDINLKVKKGEVLGIVGRNGSGKSTLLKIISGIIQPSKGEVKVNGNVAALLEVGSGMNPQMTGRENIRFMGNVMGFEPNEMDAKTEEIIDFAEIGDHIDQPVRTYSSGMKSKLGFAISTAIKPDILILDEVLSVGDALFRRKAFVRMENLIKDENTTVLFVSHSEQSVVQICSRAIWLEKGEQVFSNNAKEVIEEYQRFIYSQEESQKQILGQIRLKNDIGKQPEILTPGDNHIKRPLIKNYNDHFLPELVSKSIRIYGDYNVHISDIMIINKKKQKVNLLKSGESYQLVYRVESRENAGNVKLGMRIKTISSVDISIASYTLGTMNIGDTYDIQWSFKCILLPGDYYLNIGINGDINGKAVVLKRITDVLLIRVVKTAEKDELISYWGLVSMKQEIEIQKPVTIKD